MNYYIATSSLNMENILSTESISPVNLYQTRSFGYRNFYQIPQLKDFSDILLFSEIPYFKIDDELRENYPMVIQISTKQQFIEIEGVAKSLGCKVYYSSQTIHITPINTKFLFFTDKACILAYQNCLDSKMCKLVDYFQMQIVQPSKYELCDISKSVEVLQHHPIEIINSDNQYNRVKGFIYGYFIGLTKSLSANTAKMLAIQRRIYDILAAIKSNGGKSNATFTEELISLDKKYTQLDSNIIRSRELWANRVSSYGLPIEKFNKFLHDYNLEAEAKRKFCQQEGIILRKTLSEYTSESLEQYGKNMSSYMKSLINQERGKNKENIDLCSQLDINPDFSLAMMSLDDAISSFFNKILSNIIWNNVINNLDDLRINRFEIATKVTQIVSHIIEETGNVWKGSTEQLYFHHLRQNIKEFTPFNIQEIDNVILQSLAAFLLKGEDYDSLINYLESNSILNYQYALSLWGAILGYVQIPRTIIFSSMDRNIFMKLYKDAYKLMYRKELDGELELNLSHKTYSMPSISSNMTVRHLDDDSLARKVDAIMAAHPRIIKNMSDEDRQLIENEKINASDEITFVRILANKMKDLKKGIFPYLQKAFYPDYKKKEGENQKQDKLNIQTDLFRKNIIYDYNAKSIIAQCRELGEYRKRIEEIFVEFQKSYQSGYYFKHQEQYERNNEEVIDHFCKWCLSSKNKNAIPWSKENSNKIDKLKELLLSKYHD